MNAFRKAKLEQTQDFRHWGGPPSPFYYGLIRLLTGFLCGLLLHPRIRRDSQIASLTGPVIVLANHPSYLDPVLVAMTLNDRRINFLTTQVFFRNHWIGKLLRKVGAIPKIQFRSDSRALKAMLTVLARCGTLSIFPEGQRSIDGTMSFFDEAIAKLIRKTKSAVVIVHIDGAYLSWPRWSNSWFRRGRIDVRSELLMTGEVSARTDVAEIQSQIVEALRYQDYDWQRQEKVRFKSSRPADGLHQILHQCPSCLRELAMRSERRTLHCCYCGYAARMDDFGFLNPTNLDRIVYSDARTWHLWQQDQQRALMLGENASSAYPVSLDTADGEQDYMARGSGILTLSAEGFDYEGAFQDQPIIRHFPLPGRGGMNADFGLCIELASSDISYRFTPDDGQKVIQIVDQVAVLQGAVLLDTRLSNIR
jgi:1-acyl-sn-glycerol-3-phosphate acyltransferase